VRSLRARLRILGKRLESRSRPEREVAPWWRAAKHLQHMLRGEQRIDDAVEAGTKGNG
jgi:hypothetical protein